MVEVPNQSTELINCSGNIKVNSFSLYIPIKLLVATNYNYHTEDQRLRHYVEMRMHIIYQIYLQMN